MFFYNYRESSNQTIDPNKCLKQIELSISFYKCVPAESVYMYCMLRGMKLCIFVTKAIVGDVFRRLRDMKITVLKGLFIPDKRYLSLSRQHRDIFYVMQNTMVVGEV